MSFSEKESKIINAPSRLILRKKQSISIAKLKTLIESKKFTPTSQDILYLWNIFSNESDYPTEVYWEKLEIILNTKVKFDSVCHYPVLLRVATSEIIMARNKKRMATLEKTIKRLIEAGFHPDYEDCNTKLKYRINPLSQLISRNCMNSAKILLEAGASTENAWFAPVEKSAGAMSNKETIEVYDFIAPYGQPEHRHEVLFYILSTKHYSNLVKIMFDNHQKYDIDWSYTDEEGTSIADYAQIWYPKEFLAAILKDEKEHKITV